MLTEEEILVSQHLNKIPHLNLTKYLPEVPLREMLKELFQFNDEDFYPYVTGNTNQRLAEHMSNNWKGMCIIDSCKEGRHNLDYLTTENNFNKLTFNLDEQSNFVYAPTDVGSLVPSMIDYIYTIIDRPQKTRISRIMPNGGNATWHSHYRLAETGDKKFNMNDDYRLRHRIVEPVIHIPLITNKDTYFGVAEHNPMTEQKFTDIAWQKYAIGEVWLFNSYFYHNVFNRGTAPRDHIMMYMPFNDKKMFPVIKQALKEYKGLLLNMDKLE